MVKNLPTVRETWVQSLDGKDPLEEGTAPTPVLLPGESHGQRSLEDAVPGVTESRTRLGNDATAAARPAEMNEPVLNACYSKRVRLSAFNSFFKWIFKCIPFYESESVCPSVVSKSLRPQGL